MPTTEAFHYTHQEMLQRFRPFIAIDGKPAAAYINACLSLLDKVWRRIEIVNG
jgi:hypothetical protein